LQIIKITREDLLKQAQDAYEYHVKLNNPPPPRDHAIGLTPPNWWALDMFPVVTSEYRYKTGKDENEKLRKKGRIPAILMGGIAPKLLLHIPFGTFASYVTIGFDPDEQKFRLLLPNKEVWLVRSIPDLHHMSLLPKNMIFIRDILTPHIHAEGDGFEIPKKKYPNYKKIAKEKKKSRQKLAQEIKARYQVDD